MGTHKEVVIELDNLLESMPNVINAMKVVSYSVKDVIYELYDNGYEPSEIDLDLVTQYIHSEVAELMESARTPYFLVNADGQELEN